MTELDETPTPQTSDPEPMRKGWGEWVIAGAVLALGVAVLLDGLGQRASTSASGIGAGFMPTVVGGLLLVLGAILVVQLARGKRGEPEQAEGDVDLSHTRWIPVATTIGALVFFILTVQPLGYIPASIVMFWAIAWAMGSRKYLMSLLISVIVSVVIYFAFTRLLTIQLPAGILEGVI